MRPRSSSGGHWPRVQRTRQIARGERPWAIDRSIATRGLVIAAFELWISWFVMPPKMWLLQVLYTIGVSFLLMVPLRRLPNGSALALSIFLIVAGEAMVGIIVGNDPSSIPLPLALLAVGGERLHSSSPIRPFIGWRCCCRLGLGPMADYQGTLDRKDRAKPRPFRRRRARRFRRGTRRQCVR